MSAEVSIAEAKSDKLFYVVANAILVNTVDRTCLMVRRSTNEKEAGGEWAFPGGKGEHKQIIDGRVSNFFGVVALSECEEETGLSFDPMKAKIIDNGAFVRKDGIPVVWTTVAVPYEGGEVSLEEGSFSESGWFSEDTLPLAEECVGSSRDEAIEAIRTLAD